MDNSDELRAADQVADEARSLLHLLDRLGWTEVARGRAGSFVVVEDQAAAHQAKIPLDDSYRDFRSALELAYDRAAQALYTDADTLRRQLRAEQTDVLYVTADVQRTDSLLASTALHLLNGAWQTITASAWAEDSGRPGRTLYTGHRSSRLTAYLAGLRLAHTEPGSFRFPVISPLPPYDIGNDDETLSISIEPFERRALRKTLEAVEAAVDSAIDYRDRREFTFENKLLRLRDPLGLGDDAGGVRVLGSEG